VIDESVILPDVSIGAQCRVRKAVIDKGCVIPAGTVIGEDAEADRARFHVTPGGVTLVTPSMLGQLYSAKAV
jgi:glucose-1-phosphate adenylyltransferase